MYIYSTYCGRIVRNAFHCHVDYNSEDIWHRFTVICVVYVVTNIFNYWKKMVDVIENILFKFCYIILFFHFHKVSYLGIYLSVCLPIHSQKAYECQKKIDSLFQHTRSNNMWAQNHQAWQFPKTWFKSAIFLQTAGNVKNEMKSPKGVEEWLLQLMPKMLLLLRDSKE